MRLIFSDTEHFQKHGHLKRNFHDKSISDKIEVIYKFLPRILCQFDHLGTILTPHHMTEEKFKVLVDHITGRDERDVDEKRLEHDFRIVCQMEAIFNSLKEFMEYLIDSEHIPSTCEIN